MPIWLCALAKMARDALRVRAFSEHVCDDVTATRLIPRNAYSPKPMEINLPVPAHTGTGLLVVRAFLNHPDAGGTNFPDCVHIPGGVLV